MVFIHKGLKFNWGLVAAGVAWFISEGSAFSAKKEDFLERFGLVTH